MTPSVADDFAADAPLRRRPVGDPAPRYTVLPPGASAADLFHEWGAAGRVPAGSLLARRHGLAGADDGWWEVVALPGRREVLPAEQTLPAGRLAGWRTAAVVVEGVPSRTYVVLAPGGGA